ncbi:MAG TPA: MarR family transcriptional regulator [Polyangiaceae bacterium]|nr:MarR family transcriptional regulator [Polyangiaceae bacterium]
MPQPPNESEYRALAEFRHRLRLFLTFSEAAARAAGVEPQQHQFLLALKGLSPAERPTVRALADQLQLKHHTVVGLVNRLVARGLVARERSTADAREILIRLTSRGDRLLAGLSSAHRAELETNGPALVKALQAIVRKRRR